MFQYVRYLRICIIVFVSSISLRLFPIEIPKMYKIEAPYSMYNNVGTYDVRVCKHYGIV